MESVRDRRQWTRRMWAAELEVEGVEERKGREKNRLALMITG